ncbi:hypothetical protein [Streptomyces flavofungini]|uniref:hypothetical protein n=1 Tax=Streptomyces flavofungini TaxID=68200 RepID=UPI0034DF5795
MPGTALLIAAAPVNKSRLVDAASVLPVLAAVTPAALAGTATASVVELADPLEPQTVLTRLRAAAMAPGPLTIYLIGQVHLDRRQRLPHLALARTTPATMRYTGFPWHWIGQEVRLRPAGSTTVIADLHTDAESWQTLATRPLDAGPGVALYGRIAPPVRRRTPADPAYMKALATVLRSGHRPPALQLAQSLGDDAKDLVLALDPAAATPGFPQPREEPVPPVDPHAAITAAVQAGRHGEAAALAASWEQNALRTHGPGSNEVIHWMEVRADLARFAGDPARGCETWLAVAAARLTAGQTTDSPEVEAAADRAHHLRGVGGRGGGGGRWRPRRTARTTSGTGCATPRPYARSARHLTAQRRLEQFHSQHVG